MAIAIAIVLLVIGTVLFHFLNPWWFTPIASNWGEMDDTVNLTFWVCGAVFVAVNLFMAYAIVRYRHRKGQERRAEYEPEYKKLEWWLIGLTSVGVIAMLAPGPGRLGQVRHGARRRESGRSARPAMVVELPAAGRGRRARRDRCALIGADNPFGMDANDPRGQDDVLVSRPGTAPAARPAGQGAAALEGRAARFHRAAVPRQDGHRAGHDHLPLAHARPRSAPYEILCEELCGMGHFVMRGRVVVDDADAYQQWLAAQQTFAQITARPAADAVAGQGAFAVCTACHGADRRRQPGAERAETRGAAGLVPRAPAAELQARHSRRSPGRCDCQPDGRDGRAARRRDHRQRRRLHRRRCPTAARPPRSRATRSRGASRYTTCAYCHGDSAKGSWATNAPRLSGMSDWYMARQLQQFKQGHRGRHPQDFHGRPDGRAEQDRGRTARRPNDLLAYINTLH